MIQQVGSPEDLYDDPINLFVAGFIGSPAMNFMPATVEGETVKLPIADVRLPDDVRGRVGGSHGKALLAGIRPENFEDASLVGEARDRGTVFTARIEVLSRSARSCTRTSPSSPISRSSRRSCASWRRTRAAARSRWRARRAASWRASTPPARCASARTPSSGFTPPACTSSTPKTGATSPPTALTPHRCWSLAMAATSGARVAQEALGQRAAALVLPEVGQDEHRLTRRGRRSMIPLRTSE